MLFFQFYGFPCYHILLSYFRRGGQ
ncbi:hypothetical protein DWY59_06470 [Ruminococcus bromii]|nr:hypothetical protein DWY59_06470 [Ruminococcus bromii]